MREAEKLSLRFALEAVVRFAITRIPSAPRRQIMRFARIDGSPTLEPGHVPLIAALAVPLNNIGLQESQQYATLVSCFGQFPALKAAIQAPIEDTADPPLALLALTIRFVMAYVGAADEQTTFNAQRFEALFDRLVTEFDASGWRWIRRTPLHNFAVPADAPQRIDIAPGVAIRPLDDNERDAWHNSGGPDQLQWAALANVTHVIEITYERPRHEVLRLNPDVQEDDVIFVLRMSGGDTVAFGITEQRLDSIWNVSIHFANFRMQPQLSETKSTFDAATQHSVQRNFSSFLGLDKLKSFQFAKRRYNDGCGRAVDEDRVVDFWIVAENLFSNRRDGNKDLRQRLSTRLATFVAAPLDLRAQVFAEAFASYRDRSEIVHGSLRRSITPSDVQLVQPHVKAALRRILDEGHLPDLRQLDAL